MTIFFSSKKKTSLCMKIYRFFKPCKNKPNLYWNKLFWLQTKFGVFNGIHKFISLCVRLLWLGRNNRQLNGFPSCHIQSCATARQCIDTYSYSWMVSRVEFTVQLSTVSSRGLKQPIVQKNAFPFLAIPEKKETRHVCFRTKKDFPLVPKEKDTDFIWFQKKKKRLSFGSKKNRLSFCS